MTASNGNCFLCGKTDGKIKIKNHLLKDHNSGDEDCYLFKAEGAYNKNYWLFFTVSLDATLEEVDGFLRAIWCECCDHLSAFYRNREELDMSCEISDLSVRDSLHYVYDFGTTTGILLTVVKKMSRPGNSAEVLLLARNEPPIINCESCEAPAVCIATDSGECRCKKCSKDAAEDHYLPIVNSPRVGRCGFTGNCDCWTFDPTEHIPED